MLTYSLLRPWSSFLAMARNSLARLDLALFQRSPHPRRRHGGRGYLFCPGVHRVLTTYDIGALVTLALLLALVLVLLR